ncbi:MAG: hypothetical protein Q7U77_07325 [Sediminibacterium sp.]|uniref:hypothetical protein n=1 Tax=Sediminibacterium sp. TaxID=1917865 RepID=UPI002722560E|nr:hypothetical protein [Sediminibacterium sp.]MDO8996423.1 hypothetical protein [Sediminibacterium sp.]
MEKTVKRTISRAKPSTESTLLIKAAKNAAKNAIRTSKALGLDITYLKNGIIYKETVDGKVIAIGENKSEVPQKINLKKGSILNAKN